MYFKHCQFLEWTNNSDLIKALSRDIGLTTKEAEEVVNTTFDSIVNVLAKAGRVKIRGFGSFKVKQYDGYTGRNPKTGALIEVKPKRLPFIKCGKDLKERVNIL